MSGSASASDASVATSFNRLDPLSQLAIAHGTDKYGEHFYTPHYHRFLAPLRERPVTVLEVGVGGYDDPAAGGESLAMWRDYFPSGRIVGVDIVAKGLDLGPRVEVRQGSMTDAAFLQTLAAEFGPFDLVVDDGSHVSADTIGFVTAIFPFVADGGLLAIEDTQTSYWPAFRGSLSPEAPTTMNFVKAMIDEVDHAERSLAPGARQPHPFAAAIRGVHRFHNLVLIEKGDNAEASNFAPDRRDPALREALEAYRALLASGDATEAAALACARLARDLGGADEAFGEAERLLERFPDSWRLRLLAARAALDLGRIEAAVAHAGRAMRDDRLDACLLIAETPRLRSRFPDLAAAAERTAAASPGVAACLEAARIFELLKDKARALHWLHEGVRRARAQRAGFGALADTLRRAGEFDLALEFAGRAARASRSASDLQRHGVLLRAAGRFEEAVEALSDAAASNWRSPRAHLERAHALAALGRHAEAFEAAKSFASLSLQPKQGTAS